MASSVNFYPGDLQSQREAARQIKTEAARIAKDPEMIAAFAKVEQRKTLSKIGLIAGLALMTLGAIVVAGHIPSIGYGGGVAMTVGGVSLTLLSCLASSFYSSPLAAFSVI